MEIEIERLSLKGYGVGLLPNRAQVEVPHTVVGDKVLIDWKPKRHPPQKGRVLEILAPAKNRVAPRCAHSQICGGCCWQQLDYEAQLEEKQKRVQEAFGNEFSVDPIIQAPQIFGYRGKMEFSFSQNRANHRFLGLMIAAAEPYVFNVEECHLGASWNAAVLKEVRSWWEASGLDAYHPPLDTGFLRYLTLRQGVRTNEKMVILNVSGRSEFAPKKEQLDSFVAAVRTALGFETTVSIFLRIHQTKKGTPTQFYEMQLFGPDHIAEELHLSGGKLWVKISPASFFQPNPLQAEILYDEAVSFLKPGSMIYDLYSGTGTLGLAAARRANQVVGIEFSPEAVLDAEENKKRNGIQNIQFHQGDVGQVLTRLMKEKGFVRPDAAMVDPPRSGLDPLAIHHLKTLLPQKIIYISCNPTTQAQNVEELTRSGYRIKRIQPLDQFPHTYHIENIAFLER